MVQVFSNQCCCWYSKPFLRRPWILKQKKASVKLLLSPSLFHQLLLLRFWYICGFARAFGTMNVDAILSYEKNPDEDFYRLLGCDRSSNTEQILAEFKVRAKECHPDKQANRTDSNPERFQKLLKVVTSLSKLIPFFVVTYTMSSLS